MGKAAVEQPLKNRILLSRFPRSSLGCAEGCSMLMKPPSQDIKHVATTANCVSMSIYSSVIELALREDCAVRG